MMGPIVWLLILQTSSCCVAAKPKLRGGLESSPLTEVEALEEGRVLLPCQVSPPISSDDTILVLFYRRTVGTPIYSIDGRNGPVRRVQHWYNQETLGSRAYFDLSSDPPGLVLSPVTSSDQDEYRCRVDFRSAPTRNVRVNLKVIVPPKKIRVVSEAGVEVSGVIGPYPVGASLSLHCRVDNGRPAPHVTWWNEDTLLDDVIEEQSAQVTVNTLTLPALTRSDLYLVLTCKASNSNLSVPLAAAVTLDMSFPPLDVKILGSKAAPLSEGRQYKIVCESSGSRPSATITWWKDGMLMTDARTKVNHAPDLYTTTKVNHAPDLYTTTKVNHAPNLSLPSVLASSRPPATVTPRISPTFGTNVESFMGGRRGESCRYQTQHVPSEERFPLLCIDGKNLTPHRRGGQPADAPRLSLAAGTTLDMENIKEGNDVYFQCGIKANPNIYKVQWFHNGEELVHNVSGGIIQSNRSLVLQGLSKTSSGQYTCSASNLQGTCGSNAVQLSVKFSPLCRPGQTLVYGAGKMEELNITCSVEAHPEPTSFRWAFNSSSEVVDIPASKVRSVGKGRSQVTYTPRRHQDYGSLLCWATNDVGVQRKPCIFHVIHASAPDPVNNCTVENISSTGVGVRCQAGWDGGLGQTFTLSVTHARAHTRARDNKKASPRVLANTSTSPRPEFSLSGLEPGTEYVLTIMGVNKKGQSEPVRLAIFTLKDVAEKRTSPVGSALAVTSLLAVVLGVLASLLVMATVVVVLVRRSRRLHHNHHKPEVKMVVFHHKGSSPGHHDDADDPNPDVIPVNDDHQVQASKQHKHTSAGEVGSERQHPCQLELYGGQLQHHLSKEYLQASEGSLYINPGSLLRQQGGLTSREQQQQQEPPPLALVDVPLAASTPMTSTSPSTLFSHHSPHFSTLSIPHPCEVGATPRDLPSFLAAPSVYDQHHQLPPAAHPHPCPPPYPTYTLSLGRKAGGLLTGTPVITQGSPLPLALTPGSEPLGLPPLPSPWEAGSERSVSPTHRESSV
ncbi:neural cell adhesion molecule 2-like [Panulirus ornatus]|uniref:neural cell adhesion molecule 2-like n=1 Tax=Panulirus ornatus TaxID=150431 RepID=UPI003A86398C